MERENTLVRAIEDRFKELSERWRTELESIDFVDRDNGPNPGLRAFLRSPAKVEQAFGGINSSLWDDPFEWTLPEAMASRQSVAEYLDEVDEARSAGFRRILSDADLAKVIRTPFGDMSLADLLLNTLCDSVRLAAAARTIVPGRRKT
ncbi:MAG: hypothetical protein IPM63_04275 [Acidobacteriota bacterium]|nr:MAG: hypothetical protein IPM63_04275 [Acidobacteriota bacterium]